MAFNFSVFKVSSLSAIVFCLYMLSGLTFHVLSFVVFFYRVVEHGERHRSIRRLRQWCIRDRRNGARPSGPSGHALRLRASLRPSHGPGRSISPIARPGLRRERPTSCSSRYERPGLALPPDDRRQGAASPGCAPSLAQGGRRQRTDCPHLGARVNPDRLR